MIRRVITAILRLTLRVYFRRIEVTGRENVPPEDAVIFVLNHPNALVDPAFLLCLAPRRLAFIAKTPLFRTPVIGYIVRALDSLPAYRRQDEGEDAIVRTDEALSARLDQNGPAQRAHARVDHDHVNRLRRKVAAGLGHGEGGFGNVVRTALVRDVDDLGARADSQNDALHRSGEMVAQAEIRG